MREGVRWYQWRLNGAGQSLAGAMPSCLEGKPERVVGAQNPKARKVRRRQAGPLRWAVRTACSTKRAERVCRLCRQFAKTRGRSGTRAGKP